MGQSQSGEPDDSSCFRACMREKKSNTMKQPAAPLTLNIGCNNEYPDLLEIPKTPEKKKGEPLPLNKNITPARAGQTSLQQRLQESVGKTGELEPVKQKQACESGEDDSGVILGLVSKFSSCRKTTLTKHRSPTKITTVSEGLGTRSNWQKQNGESQETSSKSHGVSTESTKSRKVLLNKIEHLKQKYYERELEIQIYQNENQYQEQLEEEKKKNTEQSEGSGHSASRGQEETIRAKILEKLNKRKMMKQQPPPLNKKKSQEEPCKVYEELELFSREGPRPDLEESLHSTKGEEKVGKSMDVVLPKEDKLNISKRSVNRSQDISTDERIQFSGYSQNDTLQEIRECDEEEEDYKSKMESKGKSQVSRVSKAKVISRRAPTVEEKEEESSEREESKCSGANRDKILLF